MSSPLCVVCVAFGRIVAGAGRREDGFDLDDVYGEMEGEGDDGSGMVPPGKEPQLWEFARDVVTSLVSDLAVVSVGSLAVVAAISSSCCCSGHVRPRGCWCWCWCWCCWCWGWCWGLPTRYVVATADVFRTSFRVWKSVARRCTGVLPPLHCTVIITALLVVAIWCCLG